MLHGSIIQLEGELNHGMIGFFALGPLKKVTVPERDRNKAPP